MRIIVPLNEIENWCIKGIDDSHDAFGNLISKGIQYRQGYRQALEDVLYQLHFYSESEFVSREYAVDIRDIQKKFDDATKDENLAPITRLAIGAAKEIVLNNGIAGPIA